MKTAIIAGATGLIGAQLLELLVRSEAYEKVIVISRKTISVMNPKVRNVVVDFDKLWDYSSSLKGDDVFCCLGTTIKQAGSKDAFKKVDFEYPATLARITKREGAKQFLIVTAMGANKMSSIFYNQVKGEVQESVTNVGFDALHILQPSILDGPRAIARQGEGMGLKVIKFLDILIPKKYKAIESIKVAHAMIQYAADSKKGVFTHDSAELQGY